MSFEDLVPVAALETFEPTVFGFRIHHSSNSISKKTLRLKDDSHPDQQGQGNEWNVNSGSLSNSNGHISNNASNYTEWNINNNNRHSSNNYMSGTASATATGTDTQKGGFRLTKSSLVNRIVPITSNGGMHSNGQNMIANHASNMDRFVNNSNSLSGTSQSMGLDPNNSCNNNAQHAHSNQDRDSNSNQIYMNKKPQDQDINILEQDSNVSTCNHADNRRKKKLALDTASAADNVSNASNDSTSGKICTNSVTSTNTHTTSSAKMTMSTAEASVRAYPLSSNDNTAADAISVKTQRKGIKRAVDEMDTSNEHEPKNAKRKETALNPDPKVSSDGISSTDALDK